MPIWSRPDATAVRDASATRRMMPLIMPTRNESVVYFEQQVDVTALETALHSFREHTNQRATILHAVLWNIARIMAERPRLNRFVAGGRLWQRRGFWASFSAKKEKSDQGLLRVVKREIHAHHSFAENVRHIEEGIQHSKTAARTGTETEVSLLLLMPLVLLRVILRLQRWLDYWGLLPRVFIDNDPMYASVFVANLGSLNMDAGYHHLYEYGNIPIFVVIGRVQEQTVLTSDGAPMTRRVATLRFTFDERIEDGLYCARALELLKQRLEQPDWVS